MWRRISFIIENLFKNIWENILIEIYSSFNFSVQILLSNPLEIISNKVTVPIMGHLKSKWFSLIHVNLMIKHLKRLLMSM